MVMVMALGQFAQAQDDVAYTQYWTVPNYYNAAAIGSTDFIRLRGGMRMQWVGIDNAPKSFLITADSPFKLLGKRLGAGFVMQQESIGVYKNMNLTAQVAYGFKSWRSQTDPSQQLHPPGEATTICHSTFCNSSRANLFSSTATRFS